MDFERVESRREDFYVRIEAKRRSSEGCNFFQRNLSTLPMKNVSSRLSSDYI